MWLWKQPLNYQLQNTHSINTDIDTCTNEHTKLDTITQFSISTPKRGYPKNSHEVRNSFQVLSKYFELKIVLVSQTVSAYIPTQCSTKECL